MQIKKKRICIHQDPKLSICFNIRVLRSKLLLEDFVLKYKSSDPKVKDHVSRLN
jgi:hypothetical protein